jgi:hypothetical protein
MSDEEVRAANVVGMVAGGVAGFVTGVQAAVALATVFPPAIVLAPFLPVIAGNIGADLGYKNPKRCALGVLGLIAGWPFPKPPNS